MERFKSRILDGIKEGEGFRLTFFHWRECTVIRIDPYCYPSSTSGWYEELGQNLSQVSSQVPAVLWNKIPLPVREQLIGRGILKNSKQYGLEEFFLEHNIQVRRRYVRPLTPGLEGSGHLFEWELEK